MSNSPAEARIEQLEQIEEDVINILKTSGNTLLEVAKDRPSQKAVATPQTVPAKTTTTTAQAQKTTVQQAQPFHH